MLVICDIDGTVANWFKRAKKAGVMPDRKHRDMFQAWLDAVQSEKSLAKDEPIPEVVETIHALMAADHKIIFLTGRSEKYRAVTETWITKHLHLFNPDIIMRPNRDWRSAAAYKEEMLKDILKKYKQRPTLAVDDDYDGDVTKVYHKLGILHLKVMP